MNSNENGALWLFFIGFRQFINVEVSRRIREIVNVLWGNAGGRPVCWLCGYLIWGLKNVSADHVIPVHFCWLANLPELIVDPRNIKLAHKKCNTKRGHNITGLPMSVREMLDKRIALMVDSE